MKQPKVTLACDKCTKAAWTAMEAVRKQSEGMPASGACYCRHEDILVTFTCELGRDPVSCLLQGLGENAAIRAYAAVVAKNQGILDRVVPTKPDVTH